MRLKTKFVFISVSYINLKLKIMRRFSIRIFAFVFALFAYQSINAQNVLLEESFEKSLGDFTIEGFNGDNNNIWQWDSYYHHALADGYGKFVGTPVEVYLVSPVINLVTNNTASFGQNGQWFNNVQKEVAFCIRESGGTWEDIPVTLNNSGSDIINTGDIIIPEKYDNKAVQFGFKYTSKQSSSSGVLHISDFVVKSTAGGSADKVSPEISFNAAEAEIALGGDTQMLPVLDNPNAVAVTYSSSNPEVATVDETGAVALVAAGVTTIKAVSAETDKYLAGEASYVLTVVEGGAAAEVLFEETFASALGDFVEENTAEATNIWKWFFITQSAYAKAEGAFMDSHLVSPEIMLATQNTAAFSYRASDFADLATEVKFSVREIGGEWTDLDLPVLNNNIEWQDVIIEIPAAFDNKKVQIAFKYAASAGTLCVKNLVVSGVKGAAPVEKADPQISFEVGDVEAILGQPFEAPVINNPNGVEVIYSSNKPEVATVNPATGEITLVAEGFTTITATSVENEQFKSASVNYVLTVKPAGDADIIFSESFEIGLGDFTVEGEGAENVWMYYYSSAKADGYTKVSGETVSYLVSPVITLKSNNVMSFDYESLYFSVDRINKDMRMAIRLEGGEWTYLEIPNRIATTPDVAVESGEIVIPAEFDNQKVQVAFAYGCDGSISSGMWYVRNLVVKSKASVVEKKDPEISFAEETHNFYFDTSSFAGVELINPNNVEVVYSIENNDYSVADVEPATGIVWIYNYGTVVITATSVENDEFKEGTASYTLVVTDIPTSIEGITADELENGKVYDLQGRRVNKLSKGVFVVNGKKVIVK